MDRVLDLELLGELVDAERDDAGDLDEVLVDEVLLEDSELFEETELDVRVEVLLLDGDWLLDELLDNEVTDDDGDADEVELEPTLDVLDVDEEVATDEDEAEVLGLEVVDTEVDFDVGDVVTVLDELGGIVGCVEDDLLETEGVPVVTEVVVDVLLELLLDELDVGVTDEDVDTLEMEAEDVEDLYGEIMSDATKKMNGRK